MEQLHIEEARAAGVRDLLPDGWRVQKRGAYLIGACPFCGGRDRFNIKLTINRWMCRHCQHSYANAIDFVMRRDRVTFPAAVTQLTGNGATRRSWHRPPSPSPEVAVERRDLSSLMPVLAEAHERLQRPQTGRDKAARLSLYQRGITDVEIGRYRLGYVPNWVNVGGIKLSPKIVIPRFVDGELRGVNSKTYGRPKYRYTGQRGMFNGDVLADATTAIVVEGEFDAMLLSRFTTAAVVTLGGSSQRLTADDLFALSVMDGVYVCMDGDAAGRAAYDKLVDVLGQKRVRKVVIPAGLDVTDVWRERGDVGVLALLPKSLRMGSVVDSCEVWIGKVMQTECGKKVTVEAMFGDGVVGCVNGGVYQVEDERLSRM